MTTPDQFAGERQWRAQVIERFGEPQTLPVYTVSTLPTASSWQWALIAVSDGTSNKRLAISDGTNWRWPDGAIVS
jgi:hypothetical protein